MKIIKKTMLETPKAMVLMRKRICITLISLIIQKVITLPKANSAIQVISKPRGNAANTDISSHKQARRKF